MGWYKICQRTERTVGFQSGIGDFGDCPGEHPGTALACGCGAPCEWAWDKDDNHPGWDCPICEEISAAQKLAKVRIRLAIEEYRRSIFKVSDEWDMCDSDGFWQGEGEEMPLELPDTPVVEAVVEAAGLTAVWT